MTRHAKASSVGSTQGQGSRPGSFVRWAGATRGSSGEVKGSSAPAHRSLLATFSLAAALLVLALFASSAVASKQVISDFGTAAESGSFGGELNNPRDVGVNESGVGPANAGDAYVADEANNRIERFDSAGNFVSAWGKDVIASSINERQRIVLNETTGGTYTLSFKGSTTEAIPYYYGGGNVRFILAELPSVGSGNVEVSGEGTAANPLIVTFVGALGGADQPTLTADATNLTGTVEISTIINGNPGVPDDTGTGFETCTVAAECQAGTASGENGALDHPQSVAVDQDTGNLYVSDRGNRRIDEYDGEGNFIRAFGFDVAESGPGDTGTGYEVCNEAASDACKTGEAGSGVGQYGEGFAERGFGIAVSPADSNASTGTVYLADSGNRRVDTFGLDGTNPDSFGSSSNFGEEQPRSVAVDSRGIVYASDSNNGGDIQRYDSQNADGGGVGFLAPILAPNDERQEIAFTGFSTGDNFKLTCPDGTQSEELTYVASEDGRAIIKNGLEAACGAGNLSVSGQLPNLTVTFEGALKGANQPQMTCTVLSGTGSCSITTTSEGHPGPLLVGNASSATVGLAANPAGNTLYVLREPFSGPVVVQQLGPTNAPGLTAPPTAADDTHGGAGGLSSTRGLGFDNASGRLFVSTTGDPDGFEAPIPPAHRVYVLDDSSSLPNPTASAGAVTEVANRSATLNAEVDPKGGLVDCKFQYSTDGTNWTDAGFAEGTGDMLYGSSTVTHVKTTSGTFVVGEQITGSGLGTYGPVTISAVGAETLTLSTPVSFSGPNVALKASPKFPPACASLNLNGGVQNVHQRVIGLVPNTHYFIRLQVTRPFFTGFTPVTSNEVSFTTASGPPLISGASVRAIDEHSVRISALIDPGNSPTTYVVQYGTTPALGSSTAPVEVGAGTKSIEVSPVIGSLTPATKYYLKLAATNLVGPVESEVLSISTFPAPPSFGSCPNDLLRTGPSAHLPDCRAYEQVTPTDKYGSDAYGSPYSVQASRAGDGITSFSFTPFPGGESFQDVNIFLSRLVGSEWSTAGANPPASYGSRGTVRAWSPDLRFSLASDVSLQTFDSSLIMRDSDNGSSTVLIPSGVGFESGSVALGGAFDDDSKVVFQANGNVPVTSGPAPASTERPNVYLYDRDTGTLTLVGLLPDSACASPPCVPAEGSTVPPAFDSYVQEGHPVTPVGDVYFTNTATGQLYLRKDAAGPGASTVKVSASHKTEGGGQGGVATNSPQPASFKGATPDGSKAFFTSNEELTNDANTGPEPIVPPPPPPPPVAIGRANISDGSGAQPSFIPTTAKWTAVDSGHVYWTDTDTGTIGRADIGGANPDPSFITGLENPEGIAVDSGHIYWAEARDHAEGHGTIGRAELDGSGDLVTGSVENDFITGAGDPHGVAVSSEYVYWTNGTTTDIGRATIAGASPEQSFLSRGGGEHPWGIAVNATNLYWIDQEGSAYIIKMNVGGDGESYTNVGGEARGIALDSSHIYWASVSNGSIGRIGLDFGNPNAEFVTGLEGIFGVTTDTSHIYWAADPSGIVPPPPPPSPGNDLYRYDAESGELTDLVPDNANANGAQVVGLAGYSDNGDYVYFAANGDLDGGGPAKAGDCTGIANAGGGFDSFSGSCSLYLWQADGADGCASADGCVSFIAPLDADHGGGYDWAGGGAGMKDSRVSADGRILVFSSGFPLTAYDNQGTPEFYRYDAESGQTTCLTCSPTGAPPVGAPNLKNPDMYHAPSSHAIYSAQRFLSRNLSPDGDRFFFQSTDRLVPADVNGEVSCSEGEIAQLGTGPSCRDVYEWEAPGTPGGSCTTTSGAYSPSNGGCIYLLSTGTGRYPSYLADVSESGDTAFIFSRQQLVPADEDTQEDIYAVKVDGGLASQHEARPANCEGDACRGSSSKPSNAPGAGSGVFEGPANPKQSTNKTRCPKGKRTVHAKGKVRCVAKKHKKKAHKHKSKAHKRAANNNRRASR